LVHSLWYHYRMRCVSAFTKVQTGLLPVPWTFG
jgi:hypothetical protein